MRASIDVRFLVSVLLLTSAVHVPLAHAQSTAASPPPPAPSPSTAPAALASPPPSSTTSAPTPPPHEPAAERSGTHAAPRHPPASHHLALAGPPPHAYQLSWELDLPLLATAAVITADRTLRSAATARPAYCVEQSLAEGGAGVCDPSGLNFLDRPFAGRWDPSWATFSDIGVITLALAPALLLTVDEGLIGMLNDAVVVYESALVALTVAGFATLGTERARPYTYGTAAPLNTRKSGDSALSFISGHTTFAFSLTMATFWTVHRRRPHSVYPWLVLGIGLVAASTVGLARVMAGRHFPTDVLAGVVVGSSVGTLIPMLHWAPVVLSGSVDRDHASVALTGTF